MGKGKDKKGKKKKKGKDNDHTDTVPHSLIMKYMKVFEVNWDKVETLEEVKEVFKAINLSVVFYEDEIPEHLKAIYEKGFLIKKADYHPSDEESPNDDGAEQRES
jgi:hypothetical protein